MPLVAVSGCIVNDYPVYSYPQPPPSESEPVFCIYVDVADLPFSLETAIKQQLLFVHVFTIRSTVVTLVVR